MSMETFNTRTCRNCGDGLRGRSDKMFCDDGCRNQYHNQLRKLPALGEPARSIQRQLVKNRRILDGLLKNQKRRIIDRDILLRHGFSFSFISHQRTTAGLTSYYCFDLGYKTLDAGRIMIFRAADMKAFH